MGEIRANIIILLATVPYIEPSSKTALKKGYLLISSPLERHSLL